MAATTGLLRADRPQWRVWMHHLEVHGSDDIDTDVVAWLREACEQAG